MPVKIISGSTNNSKGVINIADLKKMKNSFVEETILTPTGGRTTAITTRCCFLYKDQIDELFKLYNDASVLKINFSLHHNPTVECDGVNYSDSLTIVIEAANDNRPNRTAYDNEGDYVLIPAYHDALAMEKGKESVLCCPSQTGYPPLI